jgi:hypothetical protein
MELHLQRTMRVEWPALRKEQVDNNMGLILQGMKAGQCLKQKMYHSQCGVVVPFTRAIIDITGRPF